MATRRRATVLAGLGGLAAAVLAAQALGPEPPPPSPPGAPTLAGHVPLPDSVSSLLERACADCHSDRTRWPWYARVAPVSWLVTRDVRHGRSNLDFSNWPRHPTREPTPDQRLRWMCSETRDGTMPPRAYRWMHPAARLDEEDVRLLCDWTERARAVAARRPGDP